MSLSDLQAVQARLYTDAAFRERFFADPAGKLAGLPLTAAERAALAALDRGQLERFARSLCRKRLAEVRESLPGCARLLGAAFEPAFAAHRDRRGDFPETRLDAIALARELAVAPPPGSPAWLPDCARLEALRLEVGLAPDDPEAPPAEYGPHLRLARSVRLRVEPFEYDVAALYPALLRGEEPEAAPDPGPVLVGRPNGRVRPRQQRINAASAALLSRLDGARPLAAVLERLAASLRVPAAAEPAFARECAGFLLPLMKAWLVVPV